MISIVKRILKISGKYQKNVILGLIFSGLKSFFVSLMLLAVLLIMINLEQLNMTIIIAGNSDYSCEYIRQIHISVSLR